MSDARQGLVQPSQASDSALQRMVISQTLAPQLLAFPCLRPLKLRVSLSSPVAYSLCLKEHVIACYACADRIVLMLYRPGIFVHHVEHLTTPRLCCFVLRIQNVPWLLIVAAVHVRDHMY